MNYRYKTRNLLLATTAVFALNAANPALSQGLIGDAWVSVEAGLPSVETSYNGYSYGAGNYIGYTVDDENIGFAFEVGVDLANTPYSVGFGMRSAADAISGYGAYNPYFGDVDNSFTTLDFEVGRDVNLGPAGQGRITLGVRHANVATSTSYSYNGYFNDSSTQFAGLGPRIAVETSIPVYNNVNIELEAGLAVLFGTNDADFSGYNNFYGEIDSSDSSSSTVTNMDFSAAVSYLIGSNSKVSLGYRLDQFDGVGFGYVGYGQVPVDKVTSQGVFLKFTTTF